MVGVVAALGDGVIEDSDGNRWRKAPAWSSSITPCATSAEPVCRAVASPARTS
ncbi:hypothetical protein [Rhodococcus opacus]